MRNIKTTFVTTDGKYQMVYTPQRVLSSKSTRLASFDLQKFVTGDDLGDRYVTINGYCTNYKPSKAFPLDEQVTKVMQMLVTDYNAAEWFSKHNA